MFKFVARRLFMTTSRIFKSEKTPMKALEIPRPRYKRDFDEHRGYRFDAELNLHAYLERSGPSTLGGVVAEGFKSRGMRTGAEPASAEEAKQIRDFFKTRDSPQIEEKNSSLGDLMKRIKGSRGIRKLTAGNTEESTCGIMKRQRLSQNEDSEVIKNMRMRNLGSMAKARMPKRCDNHNEEIYKRGRNRGFRTPS